jgi:hypothetical protein
MVMTSPEENKIRNWLPVFYKQYNLDEDGGLHDSKVKVEITKQFYLYIPNFSVRKKAVLKHDIHHIITEYPSDLRGESEIGAWEIASGCKKYWIAWALNLYGMEMGFWFNLRGMYRAFVRGRRSDNLYSNVIADEKAVEMSPRQLRHFLSIPAHDQKIKSNLADLLLFLSWLLIGAVYAICSIVILPLIIVYNIVLFSKRKSKQDVGVEK